MRRVNALRIAIPNIVIAKVEAKIQQLHRIGEQRMDGIARRDFLIDVIQDILSRDSENAKRGLQSDLREVLIARARANKAIDELRQQAEEEERRLAELTKMERTAYQKAAELLAQAETLAKRVNYGKAQLS